MFSSECKRSRKDRLFGSGVGIGPGLGRAAPLPFRLARWLPVGAFDGRGHENDDRTLSKVRHQCFGQYERPEVFVACDISQPRAFFVGRV